MKNRLRMFGIQVGGMAKGLHDLFGDAVYATMLSIGKDMLDIMEQEMGFKIEGEKPQEVIIELGRVLQDEIGVIKEFTFNEDGNKLVIDMKGCMGWNIAQRTLKSGVDTPFTCWAMNLGTAALNRMGKKVRRKIEPNSDNVGCKVTFTMIEE